ncbi:hypothetical protein HYV70_05475 [Candidatus Uhrbacteria bacterium]|nr:hypothetical protein [Candidatus Uhrbacteria bacterium]
MKEQFRSEQEVFKPIALNPVWAEKLSNLEYESSVDEIPSPVQDCKLSIGKNAIYISRRDVFDADRSTYYPIFEQVARLLLSDGKIVGIKIDNDILAPDTFGQLADADPVFHQVVNVFNIKTKTTSEDDDRLMDLKAKSNAEVQEKMEQKKWFLEQPHYPRRMVNLDDIEAEALDVHMGAVTTIHQNYPERYVVTVGAGPCLIVGAHNPKNHASGLTHIDAFTSMEDVVRKLIGGVRAKSVRVFGGDMSSLNTLIQLKDILEKMNIGVDEWDVLNEIKSIAIDNQTGEYLDVRGR